MLEKIYYLALFLIAICIIRGFVFAWSRRSPLALTLTISALVICLAFHTLNNSVATSMDQILSGTRDFTQCDFIDQQSAEISGRGYPVIVLMCDDGQQVVNADVYSRQLMQNQDCNTFRAVTSCHSLPEK
ncbi:hypothetical protein V2E84_005848 [Klebsiella variicola]|uniref:hypothetical protein n=1 Tax=Klebsiella pneumoniae TaxID=573 RepID=UPI000282FF35|nr:hypothetical protein [Klebsiella pneumoniae]EKB70518.1 hypothetical protein HMPREF1306_05091 [Klebsiella pneumoniae subsp. pneumoniae WGLW2]EMF0765811.1 hypothetical protein [Klebsiella variicola]